MLKQFAKFFALGFTIFTIGCVTDHECNVAVEVFNKVNKTTVDDSFLLTIERRSIQQDDRWWTFDKPKSGPMLIKFATLGKLKTGDCIQQEGNMIWVWGNAFSGSGKKTWEYWVFARGFRPSRFFDDDLVKAHDEKRNFKIMLMPAKYNTRKSDEDILDGARKFVDSAEHIYADKPAALVNQLLYAQVKKVLVESHYEKTQSQAADLRDKLKDWYIKKFAAALPASQQNPAVLETIDPGEINIPKNYKPDNADTTTKDDEKGPKPVDINDNDDNSGPKKVEIE